MIKIEPLIKLFVIGRSYINFFLIKISNNVKKSVLSIFVIALLGFSITALAVPNTPNLNKNAKTEREVVSPKDNWENLSKKEKRAKRKEIKKELKSAIKLAKKQEANDVGFAILIILAVLIPPLAMGLYDGITQRFWLSLLLTLLFFLPGMIYTLVVILSDN